jgi:electron transport complex protein RnfD
LFWGNHGGCLGEVSIIALLIGAAYLLFLNIIEWRIPFFYIATVFVLSALFGGIPGVDTSYMIFPLVSILSGGLILGAFYMATDYVTSPMTKKGRIIFAIGCGLLTFIIRKVGGYPEGVCYSILLMNLVVPLIDKYTIPRAFGEAKK